MRFTLLLTALVSSLAVAAPIGSREVSALETRQNSAGSTSTSTSNCSGPLCGLTTSGAGAAEDGQSGGTSSTTTTSCGLLDCSAGSSSGSPGGSTSSTSTSP